jgi:hypothetical protein
MNEKFLKDINDAQMGLLGAITGLCFGVIAPIWSTTVSTIGVWVWTRGKTETTFSLMPLSEEAMALLIVMGYQVFMHAVRYFWMFMDADEEGCFSSHPTQTNGYILLSAFGLMLGLTFTFLVWGVFATKSPQVNYFVPIGAFFFAIVSACLSSTSFTWDLSCGKRRPVNRQP